MSFTQHKHNDTRAIIGVDELKKHIGKDIVWIKALDSLNYADRSLLLDVIYIEEGQPSPIFLGWDVENQRVRDTHKIGERGPRGDLLHTQHSSAWLAVCLGYNSVMQRPWQRVHFLTDMGVDVPDWEHRNYMQYVISGEDWDKCPAFWTVDRTEAQIRMDEEDKRMFASMDSW